MTAPLAFAIQSNASGDYEVPPQRVVNFLPEPDGFGGVHLLPTAGLRAVATLTGAGRGLYYSQGAVDDQLLAVTGSTCTRVSRGYATTIVGAVTPGVSRARFAGDRARTVVLTRPDGYVYQGGSFAQITDADFNALDIIDIGYLRGRWVALEGGSGRLLWSGIDDPTAWNALDFATAQGKPDDVTGLAVTQDVILVFGAETIETWIPTADAASPFRPSGIGAYPVGCPAIGSIVVSSRGVDFVSSTRRVMRWAGGAPQPISPPNVDEALARLSRSELAACDGHRLQERGHDLYALDIPGHCTYAFDDLMGVAVERSSYNQTLWRARDTALFDGVSVALDRDDGTLWELDPTHRFEGGDPIVRTATAFAPIADGHPPIDAVALHTTPGVGRDGGLEPGVNPHVSLAWSDDGGVTWCQPLTRSTGALGRRETVVRWNRLGRARSPGRTFRVSYSDPAALVFKRLMINPRHQ